MRRFQRLTAGALLVLAANLPLATVPAGPAEAHVLTVAAYDVALVDRALEAQAWVILYAAATHAQDNQGLYPTTVADFVDRLPDHQLMENVWTGERSIPSDGSDLTVGAIEYQTLYWKGRPVGCRVVATGRFGDRIELVSDLGWWKADRNERLEVSASR